MNRRKQLEKITVDRKIVEGLRAGQSLTFLNKSTGKGKGSVIKVRDLALQYGFIEPISEGAKIFRATEKSLPPFPEALFPLTDGRSERVAETDSYLAPHHNWIVERLQAGWSPKTIFNEFPYSIPQANFYRYLHRHDLFKEIVSRNDLEIIHSPGECLQVDWGKLFDVPDLDTGKKKTVWAFIGTVGHSRYQMVRVVEHCDYATTIAVLTSMLEELGGVPNKVTSDNPKVFVAKACKYEPQLNPAYERFASHYDFVIEALPPRTPNLKGKVERAVDPVRVFFESYDLENYTLASAQDHINRRMTLRNERKHSVHQLKPVDVFLNDEAALMKALPITPYELETLVYATIRDDGYVRFENKYYRVDRKLKKEQALVIGNSKQVYIYCKGRLLETYDRIKDRFITKACKEHYKEAWEKTLQDHGHYIKLANDIGEDVARLIQIVLARGEGFVDTRVVWGILSLNKKYHNEDINKACRSALELSQVSYGVVRKLLTITATVKPKLSSHNAIDQFKTANGKFTRPISEYKNHLRLVHSTT